jgi:hypothetical protein
MNTTIRDELIGALADVLRHHSWALAAWLGGSDANGRTDEWSDIDLVAIVEDDKVEEAIAACKQALVAIAPIALELRLPMPTWHGHDQIFWQLEGVPDWCMIDLVVTRRSSTASRFLEEERHGTALVLIDREGLVRAAPFDRVGHEAKMRERLEALIPRFRLLQHLVRKATWRGDPTEAADRYLTYTLKPLVELLRMRHCPDRYDFGMRYLRDDLPEAAWRAVEALALPASLEAVREMQQRAEEMFERTVRE